MIELRYIFKVRLAVSISSLVSAALLLLMDNKPITLRIVLAHACALDALLTASVLFWSNISMSRREKFAIIIITPIWITGQFFLAISLPV